MKRILLSLLLGLTVAVGMAQAKITATPIGQQPIQKLYRAPQITTTELRAYENFDDVTGGSFDRPDYKKGIWETLPSGENVVFPELTHDNVWGGYKVFAAGGAIALRTFDPMSVAYISTPKADYSGKVKMSFLARFCGYEGVDSEGDERYNPTSSMVMMNIMSASGRPMDIEGEPLYLGNVILYRQMGWTRIEVEFENYSAYNDAQIMLYTGDCILIDEIEVYTSTDGYIAPPVITGVSDVTNTSFKVTWEPVHNAYNYYLYLYTINGYDENGNPKYVPVPYPEQMALIEKSGKTVEEWMESRGLEWNSIYQIYNGIVKIPSETEYVFTDLDPDTQYYYGIRSHHVSNFSELNLYAMNELGVPTPLAATDIHEDGFTANWERINKAEGYVVNLYGVETCEADEPEFLILAEDFDKVSDHTTATDINDPDVMDPESGLTFDDLTDNPGWTGSIYDILLVDGMLGLDNWHFELQSPEIYVGNNDTFTLRMSVASPDEEFGVILMFGEEWYLVQGHEGKLEGEVEIPTNGVKSGKLLILADNYAQIFIDYIQITQSVKKGDKVNFYLATEEVSKDELSYTFTGLDTYPYKEFGYTVTATKGEGLAEKTSMPSDLIIVDIANGGSFNGLAEISSGYNEVTETARYSIDGVVLHQPQKSVNIVHYSDGTIRKVVVK